MSNTLKVFFIDEIVFALDMNLAKVYFYFENTDSKIPFQN